MKAEFDLTTVDTITCVGPDMTEQGVKDKVSKVLAKAATHPKVVEKRSSVDKGARRRLRGRVLVELVDWMQPDCFALQ